MTDHKCPCCGQAIDGPAPVALLDAIRLTPLERKILDHLVRIYPRTASTGSLADAIYAEDPNGGPDAAKGCVVVFVYHLRPKVRAFGWDLGGGRGSREGYGLRRLEAAAA